MFFAPHAGAQGTLVHPQPAPAGTFSPQQPTPEQIAKMPVRALPVKDFKLLSPGTGWVSTGNRLLFTTDNGAHWKDISPPSPNNDQYASVVFRDADTTWALFGSGADDCDFVVFSTIDGGTTWNDSPIKIPLPDPARGGQELGGDANIAFADKLHGWLLFDYQTGSAFSSAGLFATSDGGRTWHESNENPGFYGDIRAYPNGDVWVVGGAGGDLELAVSHKGGNGFEDVSLPAPREFGSDREPSYTLPIFEDSLHGYEAATYQDFGEKKSSCVLFATEDGGRTWRKDRILSNLIAGEKVASTVAGSTWILPFAPTGSQPALVKLRPNQEKAAAIHNSSGDFNSCKLSFLTPNEGWMNCSGTLSSTIDGGASWTAITPRHRNGVLTSDPLTPVKTMQIKTKTQLGSQV